MDNLSSQSYTRRVTHSFRRASSTYGQARKSFTQHELDYLKVIFDTFDINKDGRIDLCELGAMMRRTGRIRTRKELKELLREYDNDDDGSVDWDEFLGMMIKQKKPETVQEEDGTKEQQNAQQTSSRRLKKGNSVESEEGSGDEEDDRFDELVTYAFSNFDKDGNGYITKKEIKQTLKGYGLRGSSKEAKAMLKAADKDGDGKIDFEEFKEYYATYMM